MGKCKGGDMRRDIARTLIRKRWVVTLPRGIRAALNLFVGQLLNWDLVEDFEHGQVFIRIYTGGAPSAETVAFRAELMRKRRKESRRKCAPKSRKSANSASLQEAAARERGRRENWGNIELQQTVSELSAYLQGLQTRLSGPRGSYGE